MGSYCTAIAPAIQMALRKYGEPRLDIWTALDFEPIQWDVEASVTQETPCGTGVSWTSKFAFPANKPRSFDRFH